MSGHSKWATTKHKKAVIDAKRGKLFAKLIKNIEVAARMGGVDIEGNPTLYDAIQKAKKQSVPNKNIDSAVKRGGGLEAGGADYETIMYEGYGPNGVAVLIECLTDNRNRAASDVRVAMTRNGGNMADPGSVSYLFNRKGVVIVPKGGLTEDDVLGAVLDAGAEKVSVNSAALARPELLSELAEVFGSQCVVIAIDAKRQDERWGVYVNGGRRVVEGREVEGVLVGGGEAGVGLVGGGGALAGVGVIVAEGLVLEGGGLAFLATGEDVAAFRSCTAGAHRAGKNNPP